MAPDGLMCAVTGRGGDDNSDDDDVFILVVSVLGVFHV
jgi:hypothetical protein